MIFKRGEAPTFRSDLSSKTWQQGSFKGRKQASTLFKKNIINFCLNQMFVLLMHERKVINIYDNVVVYHRTPKL